MKMITCESCRESFPKFLVKSFPDKFDGSERYMCKNCACIRDQVITITAETSSNCKIPVDRSIRATTDTPDTPTSEFHPDTKMGTWMAPYANRPSRTPRTPDSRRQLGRSVHPSMVSVPRRLQAPNRFKAKK
jgi:hypothetical protein